MILKHGNIKTLCILQNAWGNWTLPIIFKPNHLNKSCKTIRKVIGETHVMHFSNTTPVVTPTASGRAKPDDEHIKELLRRIEPYDIVIICGEQALKAMSNHRINKHTIIMKHPASRNLSNVEIAEIRDDYNEIANKILNEKRLQEK